MNKNMVKKPVLGVLDSAREGTLAYPGQVKKWLLICCTLFVCANGCGTDARDVTVDPAGEPESRVYEVFGMDCPGCHGGLEKLIEKIPAVRQAEANWQKKQVVVTVRVGAELKDEDVYDAIKRANFTPGKRIK
jgi:copper chaperone CopZ